MFWRAVTVAAALGVVLILASPLIASLGAAFVSGGPGVTEAMKTYVLIRLMSSPFALSNYAILGYVLGRGEAGLGLGLQLVLNLSNIVLSVSLGLWLGWGIVGVAWATVVGEVLATAVGLTILVARFRRLPPLPKGAHRQPQGAGRHVRGQPRHHDPHLRADRRVRAVHAAGRAARARLSLPPTRC